MKNDRKFLWGVSTSSFQIEGSPKADGRVDSIWDVQTRTPGKIFDGSTADTACDHYRRWKEDVDLISRLGVDVYRFSISWPRIFSGPGAQANAKGLDFYDRLIDALIEKDVQPWITLFHWDLPQWIEDLGGWAHRDTVDRFVDYAAFLGDHVKDRVRNLMLVNEPSVVSVLGYAEGVHAPCLRDKNKYFSCVHHLNLGIGKGYRALKTIDSGLNVGSPYTLFPVRPAQPDEPSRRACAIVDAAWNGNFFDPLFKGTYPSVFAKEMEPFIKDGDMETCRTKLDFIGIQHYSPNYAEPAPASVSVLEAKMAKPPSHYHLNDLQWAIEPAAFTVCLTRFKHTYGDIPVYITENGGCFNDGPGADGKVHDTRRVTYLQDYILAAEEAKRQGVDIRGYFVWSLLDNFEWAAGLTPRFGLIHVDYQNQCKRTPKDSYLWLKERLEEGFFFKNKDTSSK